MKTLIIILVQIYELWAEVNKRYTPLELKRIAFILIISILLLITIINKYL